MTDEHQALETYYAQLRATDTRGRTSVSNVASISTTAAPANQVVIFDDVDTPGYSIPATLVLSNQAPYSGTAHYDYLSVCPLPDTWCFEILRRQDLGGDVGAIDAQHLADSAYVEVALAADGPHTSYWTQIRLTFGDNLVNTLAGYNTFIHRADGGYRLYRVPLRAFPSITTALLQSPLYELGVGGNWGHNAHVRLDQIVVRW